MIKNLLYNAFLFGAFTLYPMYKPTYTADSLKNISIQQLAQKLVTCDLQSLLENSNLNQLPEGLTEHLKKALIDDNLLVYVDVFQKDLIPEVKHIPLQYYCASDGAAFITTSSKEDGTSSIHIFPWPSLELKITFDCPESILSLVAVPRSELFFTAHEESIRLWSIKEKRCIQEFKKEKGVICDLVTNVQGTMLLMRSVLDNCNYRLMKLTSFPYTLSESCTQTEGKTNLDLELTPDGEYAIESEDGYICFLSLITGKVIKIATIKEHVSSIHLSPDGSFLIALLGTTLPAVNGFSQITDMQPYLFAVKDGEKMVPVHLTGHNCMVKAVKISPNGRYFVTGDEKGTLRLWDLCTLASIELKNHPLTCINDLQWSPDGKFLFVKGDKEGTYVYNFESLMNTATIKELVLIAKLKKFGIQVLSSSSYRSIFEKSSYHDKLSEYFKI